MSSANLRPDIAKPLSDLAALIGSVVATGRGQQAYMSLVGDKLKGDGLKDWGIRKIIQAQALGKGFTPATVPRPEFSHVRIFDEPGFFGLHKGMLASAPGTSPGVMAHEMGHILQEPNSKLYAAGRLSPLLGALGVAALPTNKAKLVAALAGSAASLPTLGYELDASRRGRDILKGFKYDSPGDAFVGVPTYAASTALPVGAYGLRKLVLKALTKGKA